MTTLMKASNEWSARPADERYSSLADLHAAVNRYRTIAGQTTIPYRQLKAIAADGAVQLNGRTDMTASLTNWSFGQLSQRAGAPPSYLRELPAQLAADCLNAGLSKRTDDEKAVVLFARQPINDGDGGSSQVLTARAFTSESYTRIWNSDISSRLIRLTEDGTWQPAPAAFDGSRGLYASDHDMFCFLVDNNRRIFERGPGGGLGRGFFVWNSEVGAASFGIMTFLYEYVCGNHRVWGASGVAELRLRHVGNADERAFRDMTFELRKYADSSATELEAQIQSARDFSLGGTKEEVLDKVFGLRLPQLSRKRIAEAQLVAETREDWYGSPRSAWGLAGGITEIARDLPFADERVALDRAAGKVMQLAF